MDRIISNDPTATTQDSDTRFPGTAAGPNCPSWCEIGQAEHLGARERLGFYNHRQDVCDDDLLTVRLYKTEDLDGRRWPTTVEIDVKGDDLSLAQTVEVSRRLLEAAEQLILE